jgi:hypothetical protein
MNLDYEGEAVLTWPVYARRLSRPWGSKEEVTGCLLGIRRRTQRTCDHDSESRNGGRYY